MTEEEIDQVYDVKYIFLDEVREAFRKARGQLTEEQFYNLFRDMAQDDLSLFSPWMNMEEN